MNQRFQNEEIKRVSEQYADNELYKAIRSIGPRLESEMLEFGLCSEECFMEVLELLTDIAEEGEDILPEIDNLWLRKHNEYRRLDRNVSENETSKTVGIVFGFTILAIDSSRHPFYRYTLSPHLISVVASHPFDGWPSTLEQIFSVPLSDGWFDAFIKEEPEEGKNLKLPKDLDTPNARKYFAKAIEKHYMVAGGDKFRWLGTGDRGPNSQLAYFCGRVYNYEFTFKGNAGDPFPEDSLNALFGVKRLRSSLEQVYLAQNPQAWRNKIDCIFQ